MPLLRAARRIPTASVERSWVSCLSLQNATSYQSRLIHDTEKMEKMRSMDTLTPLDARNSLLMDRKMNDNKNFSIPSTIQETAEPPSRNFTPTRLDVPGPYHARQPSDGSQFQSDSFRPLSPAPRTPIGPNSSSEKHPEHTNANIHRQTRPYNGGACRMACRRRVPSLGGSPLCTACAISCTCSSVESAQ